MNRVCMEGGAVPGSLGFRRPSPTNRTTHPIALAKCGWRPVIAALAILALASGCTSANKWFKDDPNSKPPSNSPAGPLSQIGQSNSNQVIQASATTPGVESSSANYSAWLAKADKISKRPATQLVATWRNWVDYLPDPTKEGRMGPGLAGQVFLFDSALQPTQANGSLIVDLYDVTERAPGQQGNIPERWEITKDKLKTLLSVDERLGPFFVVFLPWPTYRPDVTQVRITARYVSEGKTLYAQESNITITSKPQNIMTSAWSSESQTNPSAFKQKYGVFPAEVDLPASKGMGSIISPSSSGSTGATTVPGVTGASSGPPSSISGPAIPFSGAAANMVPMNSLQGMQSQPFPGGMSGASAGMPSSGFSASPLNR